MRTPQTFDKNFCWENEPMGSLSCTKTQVDDHFKRFSKNTSLEAEIKFSTKIIKDEKVKEGNGEKGKKVESKGFLAYFNEIKNEMSSVKTLQ